MPRRKQGHTSRTERQPSFTEVKRKTDSVISCNDTISNTATNYAGFLYTIKEVSTSASTAVNGTLHVSPGNQNFATRPLEVSAIRFITSNGNKLDNGLAKLSAESKQGDIWTENKGIRCRSSSNDVGDVNVLSNRKQEQKQDDDELSQKCDTGFQKVQVAPEILCTTPLSSSLFKEVDASESHISTVADSQNNNTASTPKELFHLPSSVYGTTAANLETVLTGLSLKAPKLSNYSTIETSAPRVDENHIMEVVATSPSLIYRNNNKFINIITHTSSATVAEKSANDAVNERLSRARDALTNKHSKLLIPLTEDSVSSNDSSPAICDKSSKFPKITSPQILEQHITKIISQNAAIVETLDPLWSKRYLRQTSQNSDSESKKLNNGSKSKNERLTPLLGVDGSHSKLQSALLGTLDIEHQKHVVLCKTEGPKEELPSLRSNNKSEGSGAAKNLLCVKQEHTSYSKDAINMHPQNPEGSIIKDLLLKTKFQTKSSASLGYSVSNSSVICKNNEVLLCIKCGSKYSDRKLFDIHCKICDGSKNSVLSTAGFKSTSETMMNSSALSSNIEQLLRSDCTNPNFNSSTEQVGQILKTQLLSPLTNYKSLAFKKRKISEPIIPMGKSKDDFPMSYVSQSEDFNLSPQRSRSQSVHLFGGEVQIREGGKLKRIKIVSDSESGNSTVQMKRKYSVIDFQPSKAESRVILQDQSENSNLPSTISPTKSEDFKTDDTTKRPEYVSVLHNTKNYLHPCTETTSSLVPHLPVIKESSSDLVSPLELKSSPPNCVLKKLGLLRTTLGNIVTDNSVTCPKMVELCDTDGDKEMQRSSNHLEPNPPTITLTPSSPIPAHNDKEPAVAEEEDNDEKKKFLAPTRPNSLPLKKKPFTMVGSTLVSPDTPRPKKNCMQLYINGQAYTYLGLKCSTRSTYCCIHRPQPMYVLQDTDPKLSMYSNWQVVPAKEELCGMTPGQMLSFYNSKQSTSSPEHVSTTAKLGELLSSTHSSYWTFRSKREEEEAAREKSLEQEPCDAPLPNVSSNDDNNDILMDCSQDKPLDASPTEHSCVPNEITACPDKKSDSQSENISSLDIEASVSDVDGNNTNDEDDEDKAEVTTDSSISLPPKRVKIFEGGFKSNEDYTYVRGRGRGKYVCEECGIRCKKPSMLKKHIRTHTDLRPYKCRHCSFAFKTKGNLTKHMKSKAHHKKCTELGITPIPTTTDDCQIDEEALAKQEQYRKKNLIFSDDDEDEDEDLDDDCDDSDALDEDYDSDCSSLATNTKNELLPNEQSLDSDTNRLTGTNDMEVSNANSSSQCSVEQEAARSLLHLSSLSSESPQWAASEVCSSASVITDLAVTTNNESFSTATTMNSPSSIRSTHSPVAVKRSADQASLALEEPIGHRPRSYSADVPFGAGRDSTARQQFLTRGYYKAPSTEVSSDEFSRDSSVRRYSISVAREARKPCIVRSPLWSAAHKVPHFETSEQPMDLRIPRGENMSSANRFIAGLSKEHVIVMNPVTEAVPAINMELFAERETYSSKNPVLLAQAEYNPENGDNAFGMGSSQDPPQLVASSSFTHGRHYYPSETAPADVSFLGQTEDEVGEARHSPEMPEFSASMPLSPASADEGFMVQESAVASGATVASSESQQIATKAQGEFIPVGTSSNLEEGKCICRICNKIFAKAGQLRIHVNIHYFERPFRCDNCGVSFRTKGHLQKHKRSVSHYNKVNMNMTFGTPSVDNPRPFKCADCKIAFRIHGHLAKHLRSKMHIMKLECLGKLPFGMYAEMERSGISLNEIDTTDCNNSLESLQVMAQKLYQRDPRRMRWHSPSKETSTDVDTPKGPLQSTVSEPLPDPLSVALSSPSAISIPVPSIVNLHSSEEDDGDVKLEPSDVTALKSSLVMVGLEAQSSSVSHFVADQSKKTTPQVSRSADGGDAESNISLHRSDTCHICGRMFKSAKFLQVHLYCDHPSWNSSSGSSPSQDSVIMSCQRQSVIAQDLVCDLCGRHFPNQNSLQQHLLTHAQPRPFVCEVCDAGFTSSASLISHLATHQLSEAGTSE